MQENHGRLAPYLAVAQVLKPQGITCELKCKPLTDDEARFDALKSVYLYRDGAPIDPMTIADGR